MIAELIIAVLAGYVVGASVGWKRTLALLNKLTKPKPKQDG